MTNVLAAVWDPSRECEVLAMGYENQTFPNKPQSLLSFFSETGAVTNVFAPVRDPRRESKVPAMAHENSELSDRPQNRPCLFQKLVWAPMFSARSWTQHKKVSSLPWATKIQHFQTSFRARLVFFRSGRGHNCFREGLGHNTRK